MAIPEKEYRKTQIQDHNDRQSWEQRPLLHTIVYSRHGYKRRGDHDFLLGENRPHLVLG